MIVRLLAIASLVLACGSGQPPDLVVPLETNAVGDWQLLVFDDSGLVTGGRSVAVRPGERSDGVVAFPDRRELEMTWTGGACSHSPTLVVDGDPVKLRLTVRNPDDPNWLPFLPIGCPSAGVPLTVTLVVSEPVQQDALEIEVVYQ